MKKAMAFMAAVLATGCLTGGRAEASDISARVFFSGTLINLPAKQAIRGTFRGNGEFGPLNLDAELSGFVLSQVETRLPERNLFGKYPVEIDLRVGKSGLSVSDSFGTNVEVFRRRIKLGKIGSIVLNRPVHPTRAGRQRLRGTGTLRYDF